MSNEEKQLLFGEYATGNISQADKRRLMAAALDDQDLFNAIAEQEELSELTVTLPEYQLELLAAAAPLPPPRRNPWPCLFTGAAARALAVTGVFFLRTQTEPKTEIAQAPPPQPALSEPAPAPMPQRAAKPSTAVLRENKIVSPEASAQAAARDEIAAAPIAQTSPPKSTPTPTREETEPVVVGSLAAPPRFQILRRGDLTSATELQDGDALVVRYVPAQSGPIDLHNLSTNTTLATRNAIADQPVDIPLTAVRGTMNLELRPRPPVALAFAESRNAAPAGASGGAVRAAEVAKERKAAPAAPPLAVRIFLTVR